MDGPFVSPPTKRAFLYSMDVPDPNPYPSNGSSKRFKHLPPPLSVPPGHVAFRLLCHASRIGGVIGKSGNVVRQLAQATGAKIRVEDAPPDCEDRVVMIIASSTIRTTYFSQSRNDDVNGGVMDEEAEVGVSAAQEALLSVFEKILEVAAESHGIAVGGMVSCRMLADEWQAGAVIGKGGNVVERIKKDTGCKIKIWTGEKLPECAQPNEEMIEIEGDVLAVKKALIAVSHRLQECAPSEKSRIKHMDAASSDLFPDIHVDRSQTASLRLPSMNSSVNYALGVRPLSVEADRVPVSDTKTQREEVKFRILCSNDRVGGVIGRGGAIVQSLQNETGATISIGSLMADCDERVITISALEDLELRYSSSQNAVLLVFSRSVEAGSENGLDSGLNKGSPVTARLLVPSSQVGCLLGKGGAIISEMRKATGTGIRIIGADQVPKCSLENEEVVQITGQFINVQDALYHVTSRLRESFSPHKTLNYGRTKSSSVLSEVSQYSRMRDPVSFGYNSMGGVSHTPDRRSNLTQSVDHLGYATNLDRSTSPRLWTSQRVSEVNPSGLTDIGRGLTSFKGGLELGSGSRTAIVTNTTVEITVPENVFGSVYGENGNNLVRLRQISGAKVVVHEPPPGSGDWLVVISGTPDEAQAAQSLLQAFILTG